MQHTPGLKAALKRGALIAAANWPLVIVGFVADSSVKLLLAVPIAGGAFLVALLLDTPLTDLLRGDVRGIVTSIVAALMASPTALAAFIASTTLVFVMGSMLQFIVVAVTLVGIYYQLRSSQSANAFTQLGALVDEWQGERLIRKRMALGSHP